MARRPHRPRKWANRPAPGPTSSDGKLNASRNAVTHGLSGKPELTVSEGARFLHLRSLIAELMDKPIDAKIDIAECAATQVLIERTIQLRHQAHMSDAGTLNELEKLVRHENRLIHRRNSLLNFVDTDDYA